VLYGTLRDTGNENQFYVTGEIENLRNFLDGLVSVSLMMFV